MHLTLRCKNEQYVPENRIGRLELCWLACTASSAAPGSTSGADMGRLTGCDWLEVLRSGACKGTCTQPKRYSQKRYDWP